jgi:hypothetical protein
MTTAEVLFVGGPHAGECGYIEVRDCLEVAQTETPVRDSLPDPWNYKPGLKIWVCRYTRRRRFDKGAVVYAPANWSNDDVLSELIRGYNP